MLNIVAPDSYINEPDITKKAGKYIKKLGKNPLIIGGRKALESLGDDFKKSLSENGVSVSDISIFSGFPSENQFRKYTDQCLRSGNDLVIGIGGGRVLDTAKAVGNISGIPIVTIPTVAATCAAWAALTVQYDDEGAFVRFRENPRCPDLILADTRILMSSPIRYLNSGIVDTFAKYYETVPLWEQHKDNLTADINLFVSKLAFDRMEEHTENAKSQAKEGIYGVSAIQVIDAIIYLAGLTGSLKEPYGHYSFAHPFYHTSTRLANTRHKLHGEKVAFGILAQLFLQGLSEEEIASVYDKFEKYDSVYTLIDLGIDENKARDLNFMAEDILKENPHLKWDKDQIIWALEQADSLVRNRRIIKRD